MSKVKYGLLLPNRGPILGLYSAGELVDIAEMVDKDYPMLDSVWAGDSLLAKPRFECNTLLAAVAARTSRVKMGPACFASFPLRQPLVTALEWASIDVLSEGRTIWPVCVGGNPKSGGSFAAEYQAFELDPSDRVGRLEESIQILQKVWTEDNVTFQGKHFSFENVTVEPKPAQKPRPPIWLVATPSRDKSDRLNDRMMRRVARYADGWMTTRIGPDDLAFGLERLHQLAGEEGRDPAGIEFCLYYNILVGKDRQSALTEAKNYLDNYYMTDFPPESVALWTALGSPAECVETINRILAVGVGTLVFRFPCSRQHEQLDIFAEKIYPNLA